MDLLQSDSEQDEESLVTDQPETDTSTQTATSNEVVVPGYIDFSSTEPQTLPDNATDIDPSLVEGVIHAESRGRANAVGPMTRHGRAYGKMQLLVPTAKAVAERMGIDPDTITEKKLLEDPELNTKLGTKYLEELKEQFGDDKLAVAAYNTGPTNVSNLIKKYGNSYDAIEPHLPRQTREYVPQVMGASNKASQSKSLSQYEPETANEDYIADLSASVPRTAQGFASALSQIFLDPKFELLPFPEKASTISALYNSKPWTPDTYGVVKEVMTNFWNAADPKELPALEDYVEPPPFVESGVNAKDVLADWRQQQIQKIHKAGISPAMFGSALDKYLTDASENELAAYTARNRGVAASIAGSVGNTARRIGTGAAAGVASVAGAVPRLAGYTETANEIAAIPEAIFGVPARDYIYKTDDNGYLVLNPDGTPITRWQDDAAQIVGQIAPFLAGGASMKALGYGAEAISGTLFAGNTLAIANDSFRTVYEETGGDKQKAYAAAMFSVPAALVSTAGEYAVIAKWANPAISALSPFNKTKYLANVFARNAAVGGASNLGQDIVSQYGEMLQTNRPFNVDRAKTALVAGAAISGVFGAYGAKNAQQIKPEAKPSTGAEPPTEPPSGPVLGLPAPEGTGRQTLPAPPVYPELPPGSDHIALDGPFAVGPETTATIPINDTVTPAEQADLAKKLENFQKSQKETATLTMEQAAKIPPELLHVFELTPVNDGVHVMLTKRTTYTPRDANTIPELDAHIEYLENDLAQHPSPTQDNALEVMQRYRDLKAEKQELTKKLGQPYVDAYMQRQELVRELDAVKAKYEQARIDGDRFATGVHRLDVEAAEAKIAEFDAANAEIQDAPARLGDVISELELVGRQRKLVLGNPNDAKMKEANRNQLLQKREILRREQEDPARVKAKEDYAATLAARKQLLNKLGLPIEATIDFTKGVRVDNHTILPSGDRWFVVDKNGDLVGGAHDYYYDAVKSLRAKPALESTQFVVRNTKSKTALTPEIEARIAKEVEAERAKAELAGKNKAAQEEMAKALREKLYKEETAAAVKRAAKEDAARKRKFTKAKKTGKTVTAEAESAESVSEGVLPEDAEVYSAKQREEEKGRIAPGSSSKVRRRLSNARKPLTSNYTKPIRFAEDSTTVVHPKVVFDTAQKLVSSISKDTKIFAGARVGKHTLGFLNFFRNFIVVGKRNELSTLLHEITHAIDRVLIGKWDALGNGDYSNVPAKVVTAAQDMADIFYGAQIPVQDTNLRTQEGFAMFFQHYATGQPVRKEILDWYHNSFAKDHPSTYAAMEELKQMSFDYYNQSPITFTQSRIIPKADGTLARIKNYLKLSNLRDEWISTATIASEIDKAANHPDIKVRDVHDATYRQAAGLAEAFVNRGTIRMPNGKTYTGLTLKEAFAPAIDSGHKKELIAYLQARRDDANFKAGLETGSNAEDIAKTIAEIEYKFPDVVKAAHNYYDLWNRLDNIEADTSKEGAYFVAAQQKANVTSTGATHGYYFPQPREGKGGRFNPLKKRTGTTRAVVDPVAHVKDAIEARLNRALKGQFKEALVDVATAPIPSSIGNYIREVTDKRTIGLTAELDKAVEAATGEKVTAADRVLYSYLAKDLDGVTSSDFKILPYMDGKRVRFFEVDPRVNRLLANELPEYVNSFWFKYLYRPSSQLLRPMATSFRMAFQLKQLARDPLTAWRYVQSDSKLGFTDLLNIYGHTVANMYNILTDRGVARVAQEMGLRFSTSVGAVHNMHMDVEKTLGNNALSGIDHIFKGLETITSIPEQAVRLSAMQLEAKRLGITNLETANLTPQQQISLILAYKRATTNFADQGYSARVLNFGVPFFTARIAEISRLPGDFRRNPGKMAALGTAMLTYGLYHALAHKDDDWYKELMPEAKMNAAWFKHNIGGVDKAVFVPLDSWSALNFGLGQAIGAKMGEDPQLPNSYVDLARAYFGQNVSPLNSFWDLASPLGKEIAQQSANKDFYFNRAIVPPNLEYQDPRLQYTEYTTELAKTVGNLTDTSPLRVEHWMRSMAPAALGITQSAETLIGLRDIKEERNTNFFVKAFSRSGSTEGIMDKSQSLFTEKLLEARANKVQESPEEATIRKQLEKINKNVSDLNTVYYGTDDQEAKDKLKAAKREQLRLGLLVAEGAKRSVTTTAAHGKAQQLRKEKTKQLGEELAKKKKALESGILKGNTEE